MSKAKDNELVGLKDKLDKWEGDALPLTEEIKTEVTKAREAMDANPPNLYVLSNSLVDLSILNLRLIDRITNAKFVFNEAKYLYESRREAWKVKLVQGYTMVAEVEQPHSDPKKAKKGLTETVTETRNIDGVAAGVADSMKVGQVKVEYELMNQAEKNYETVNLLRRSIEKAIDSIRSKLSYESKHETKA